MTFVNNAHSVLTVNVLIIKPILIGGEALRDLVDPEPLPDAVHHARHEALHVCQIADATGLVGRDVHSNELPIDLVRVYEGEGAQDANTLDLTYAGGLGGYLNDVEGVIVAALRGVCVGPGLGHSAVVVNHRRVFDVPRHKFSCLFAADALLHDWVKWLCSRDHHLVPREPGHLAHHVHHVLAIAPPRPWEDGD